MAEDNDQAYLCDLAADLLKIGKRDEAFATLLPAVERPDASPRALWLAGLIARLSWKSDAAIALLERFIDLVPNFGEAYVNLAAAYLGAHRPESAYATIERGLRLASRTGGLHALLAFQELDACNPDAAREHLRLAESEPDGSLDMVRTLLAIHAGDWNAAARIVPNILGLTIDIPAAAPPKTPPIYAAAPPAHPFAAPPSITLATSLSPRGGAGQRQAMDTWRGFAAELISINTAEEIAALSPEYPDFRFVETPRNGRTVIGKPLIFIDDILNPLAASDTDLVGIVNADIRLLDAARLLADLQAAGRGTLTLCHRMDLVSASQSTGPVYPMGFDAFFFPPQWADRFSGTRMLLGAPWWDYLFPAITACRGLAARIPDRAAIGHVLHDVNWSLESFVATGQIWLESLLVIDPAEATPVGRDFLLPILAAFRERHRLHGDAMTNARHDKAFLHQQLTNLATLVNHLIRTQAARL